ncbi:hypothetical protein BESB_074760 [Besnoitia besnoiti]|uniref:Uncharacterized protein n=1 Tax=Besnoitia besnoiti TaxID=94643 RepID=A0A2A9MAU1_BESBE|nr:uncharacterized protein BESB_074760 [Besnoitia besnoiti]PFH34324.1 hypothetical protein BESB_074760 [Besnoitia besnoiti]
MSSDEAHCPPPSRHHRRHRERKSDGESDDKSKVSGSSSQGRPSLLDYRGLSAPTACDGFSRPSTSFLVAAPDGGQLQQIVPGGVAAPFFSVGGSLHGFPQPQNVAVVPQMSPAGVNMTVQQQCSPSPPIFFAGLGHSQMLIQQPPPPQHMLVQAPGQSQVTVEPAGPQQISVQLCGSQQVGLQAAGASQPQAEAQQTGTRLVPGDSSQVTAQPSSNSQPQLILQPHIPQAPAQVHSQTLALSQPGQCIPTPAQACALCPQCGVATQVVSPPVGSYYQPAGNDSQVYILQGPAAGASSVSASGTLYSATANPEGTAAYSPLGAMLIQQPPHLPQCVSTAVPGQSVSNCYPVGRTATATVNVVGPPTTSVQTGAPGMMIPSAGGMLVPAAEGVAMPTVLPQGAVLTAAGQGPVVTAGGVVCQPLMVYAGATTPAGLPATLHVMPSSLAALHAGHVFSRPGRKGAGGEDSKEQRKISFPWCGASES